MRNRTGAVAAISLGIAVATLGVMGARFFSARSVRRASAAPGQITQAKVAAPAAGGVPLALVGNGVQMKPSSAPRLSRPGGKAVARVREIPIRRAETDAPRKRMWETSLGGRQGEGPLDAYAKWFHDQRAYPAQSIPDGAVSKALASALQNNTSLHGAPGDTLTPSTLTLSPAVWVPLGPSSIPNGQTDTTPSPVSGRVSAIAVDPTDANTVYVGGAQGGAWKSTNALSATPTWTPLTDHQSSLAVGDIAIDPTNHNIVYVGTGEPNGSCDSYYGRGILRSADGGATWTLLGSGAGGPFDSQSISKILIDPTTAGSTTTTTLWASTALGFTSSGTEQCLSASVTWNGAVWRSTDSGATWTLQNVPTGIAAPGARIHDMAQDPTNSNILYVAVRSVPTAANGGVWKSVNAKGSPATFAKIATGFPNTATAVPSIRRITLGIGGSAAPGTLYAALESSQASFLWGLFKSTDGGTTWSHVQAASGTATGTGTSTITATSGTFVTDGSWIGRRIILGGNNSGIIASVADSTHLTLLNLTVTGAFTWSTGSYPPFCDGQCFYDMTVGVDPTNATASRVYVGGNPNVFVNSGSQSGVPAHFLWRSADGGATWTEVSSGNGTGGIHSDDHKIALDASTTPARVYDGNDGGIWRSNDQGASWVTMNTNLAITQFQSVGLHPSDKKIVLGGTQDNGTNIQNPSLEPPPKWFHSDFGDGGQSLIDQSTPSRMLHTYFNQTNFLMGPAKSTTGGSGGPGSWAFVGAYFGYGPNYYNGLDPTAPVSFYAPIAAHPAFTPNVIYFGSNKLYRSPDPQPLPIAPPGSWTVKSPALVGATAGINFLSAIGVVPNLIGGKEVIYTGAADGRISVSSNVDGTAGLATWSTISGGAVLPARFVTEIEVDPGDVTGNTALVSFSGFNANTPSTPGHVFRTVNGLGAVTWTNLSGDLPDIPVNSLAIDTTKTPHVLYAGTDIGVFQSVNDGANWLYLQNGHPNVSVFGLDRNPGTGQIVSSTHGRGMFELINNGFPASFFTMAPCRVADTRNAPGPSGGPAIPANAVRTFPVTGICNIPSTATAVAINVAVWFAGDGGDFRIFPAGGIAPLASSLNFRQNIVRANNAIVPLGAGGQITIQNDMPVGSSASANLFFDVYGYFTQ